MRIRHQIDDLGTANRPMSAGTRAMPPLSASWMTKRGSPGQGAVSYSRQQHAERAAEQPLSMAPEEARDDGDAEDGCQNSSEGPKRMANSAIGGENRIMTSTPNTPPIRELTKTV